MTVAQRFNAGIASVILILFPLPLGGELEGEGFLRRGRLRPLTHPSPNGRGRVADLSDMEMLVLIRFHQRSSGANFLPSASSAKSADDFFDTEFPRR